METINNIPAIAQANRMIDGSITKGWPKVPEVITEDLTSEEQIEALYDKIDSGKYTQADVDKLDELLLEREELDFDSMAKHQRIMEEDTNE